MVVVLGMQGMVVHAKLEQFKGIDFSAQAVENQAPVAVERLCLMGIPN